MFRILNTLKETVLGAWGFLFVFTIRMLTYYGKFTNILSYKDKLSTLLILQITIF